MSLPEKTTLTLQVMTETMGENWGEIASEQTENNTEELEVRLWNEMSSTLQEAYRAYRNASASLRVSKQVGSSILFLILL